MKVEPPSRGGPDPGAEEEEQPRRNDSSTLEDCYDDCDCDRYGPAACPVCRDDWQRRRNGQRRVDTSPDQ